MSHALPPTPPEPTLSTQSAHPARATWRTFVQGFLGTLATLGVVLPIAVDIIGDGLKDYLPPAWGAWLVAAATFVAAVAATVARVMAIPAVDAWLSRLGLSSRPPA